MLSHYGYEDGSGSYYIQIDTDKCCNCNEKPCIYACPANLYEIFLDDYDDEVVRIKENERRSLKDRCVICKNQSNGSDGRQGLRCVQACPWHALQHSW